MTEHLFIEDAYLKTATATVVSVTDSRLVLDRTVFYATSGGQPGDTGTITCANGDTLTVTGATFADADKQTILHHISDGDALPQAGETVTLNLDWDRRHALMKMHTACHLVSVICPHPITGASVSETDSRVDFDMAEAADKQAISAAMMDLIEADHPIFTRWITQAELQANPGIIRSKNVRPPQGAEHVRLVCIGDDAIVDSQPCGGTHVASTGELGQMHIGKIEKKGRENRRMRIRFGPLPS